MITIEVLDKVAQDNGFVDWLALLYYEDKNHANLIYFIEKAMILYCEENIKLDRLNITKHVRMTGIAYGNDTSITDYEVDLDSIINSPKLELK
jgi:hypothetical protein